MFGKAVLFATLNDDGETLEGRTDKIEDLGSFLLTLIKEILKWGDARRFLIDLNTKSTEATPCPMLYACLKNYSQCIKILYRFCLINLFY